MMSVLAPIVIASFFGFIFDEGGGRSDASRVAVIVVDEDGSLISKDLVARLSADAALDAKTATPAAARDAVRRGKAAVAIQFPAGFGATAAAAFFGGGDQKKAEVPLFYDLSRATEAAMVQGILAGHAMEAVSRRCSTASPGATRRQEPRASRQDPDIPAADRSALLGLLQGVKDGTTARRPRRRQSGQRPHDAVRDEEEAVTSGRGTPYNSYAHSFAGMGVQFILFMAIDMGVGLLLQRKEGMWKRLRAAPLSRAVLLGGRAVSTALLSLFILSCLFAFARVVFGVRVEGSLAGFVGVCVAFSLMTASFGLLIAGLAELRKAPAGCRLSPRCSW